MTKLKPCPFCECSDVTVDETNSGIGGLEGEYEATCWGCFASTGRYDTRAEARKAWNQRVKKEKKP